MVFFELWVIQLLQAVIPYFIWEVLNLFGQNIIYVGLLGVAYWCIDKREGKIAVTLLMFSHFFNILLKYSLRMPRPDPSLRLNPDYVTDQSYGFPSGAAQTATTFWSWVSLKLNRWWFYIIGVIFIIIAALARVGIGMHFLGDVIGGILIGIVFITMSIWLVPYFIQQGKRFPKYLQDWFFPLLAILFFTGFYAAYAIFLIPYFPTENIAVSMGVLFGFGAGAILEDRFVQFDTAIDQNKRIFRAIIGLVIALVAFFALDLGFDLLGATFLLHYALRFIKYTIVGFFGAFIIPLLFKTLGR